MTHSRSDCSDGGSGRRARERRIEALFHDAVARTGTERERFLAEACEGDPDLEREVRELLAVDERDGDGEPDILDQPPRGLADAVGLSSSAALASVPERIGPYRIVEPLGSGGFADVFLAEQREPVRRRVALKILKPGVDSRVVLARFEAERQAMALMDHPGVARVLDAGATERGRPFVVMEYVVGEPVTKYADERRLTIEDRLRLFLGICEAVQHAHQRGVIHRDLKPSNILARFDEASGSHRARIIDFGIAKAIAQPLTSRTLVTERGQLVGTPEYMSPEQASSNPDGVDTRTDVYSLGVLLYELLTGLLPHPPEALRSGTLLELHRALEDHDPPTPSTRLRRAASDSGTAGEAARLRCAEPRTLLRRLSGDLDWIVMRAMERDRERRYDSVSALAADIRRHLANEPVSAGAPSVGQRARKFARRNRTLVATLTAVFVTLLAGVIATSVALVRAVGSEREEQWRLYVASIAAASDAIDSAEPDSARWHLGKAPEQHRQWEWRHLHAVSDVSHWSVSLGSSPWWIAPAGGGELAVACQDEILFLNGTSGGILRRFGGLRPSRIAVSTDGRFLTYLSRAEGRFVAVDVGTGLEVASVRLRPGARQEQVFDPQRPVAALGGSDGVVTWVDLDDGGGVRETRVAGEGTFPMVAMLHDSERIVVVDGVSPRPSIMNRDGSGAAVFAGGAVTSNAILIHADPRSSLVASNHIALGHAEINVWDAETRRHVSQIRGHEGAVRSISLRSGLLVTASDDRTIRIWNARTGDELGTCVGHTDAVVAAVFSQDGTTIYSIGLDDTMRAWRIADLQRRVVHAAFPIVDTALCEPGDASGVIAATGSRGQFGIWDLDTASVLLEGELPETGGIAFVDAWPDAPLLIVSGARGGVRVMNYADRTWSVLQEPAGAASREGYRAGVDAAGRWLACPKPGGIVEVYSFEDTGVFRHLQTVDVGTEAHSAGVSSAVGLVVVGEANGGLSGFHVDSGRHRLAWRRRANEGPIRDVAMSPDGRLIATGDGGLRGGVALWSADGAVLWRQRRHYGRIDDLCFSPDGRRLVTASLDDSVRIWDVARGEHLLALRDDHPERVCSAHFTRDGSTLVSVSFDGRIVIRAVPPAPGDSD